MISKRIKRITIRVIQYPKIILARLRGINFSHSFSCFTARGLIDENPKTVIDVGANRGDFIKASKYLFPNAKIYAFEPQEEFYSVIKNMPNVTAFNYGLWDKEGKSIFYKNKENTGSSSFLKPTKNYGELIGKIEDLSEVILLKKRFDKLNIAIERPCFLKIDVEGAEEKVIRGFGNKLREIDVLQIEWFFKDIHENQMKLSKIMPLLEKYEFSGFVQIELVSEPGKTKPYVCDLIFFKDKI